MNQNKLIITKFFIDQKFTEFHLIYFATPTEFVRTFFSSLVKLWRNMVENSYSM